MINRSNLNMLIRLAREKSLHTGRRLRQVREDMNTAKLQLTMLQEYRSDYTARLQTDGISGLSGANYRNFHAFIRTLDAAILQQNRLLERLGSDLSQTRKCWIERERRVGAIETLLARQARAQQIAQDRTEQRTHDELAAQRHHSQSQTVY